MSPEDHTSADIVPPPPDSPSSSRPEERSEIARICAGDPEAFERLFLAYYEPLVRFAFGLLEARAPAEEIVQDVFCNLWEQHESWEVQHTIAAYLYGATRNRALNWLRHSALEQRWAGDVKGVTESAMPAVIPRGESADEHTRVVELRNAIERAIQQLPARRREAFLLSREHQLTYEQIAETMGISVKTVEEQMGRALKMLRSSLAAWLE